ncbi:hypothetical protein F2Q69_00018264, partial [Brassica cretica]
NSLWTLEPASSDSWAWKTILKLRPLALQFCNTVIGNDVTTRFWFDVWSPFGQLINYIGAGGPRALRVRKEAMVADVISGSSWSLPHPPMCPLCAALPETRDHLFISCPYTGDIWTQVFARCNPPSRMFVDWNELLSWIRTATSKRKVLLRKLASQAVIFHVWKQRNNLIHNA